MYSNPEIFLMPRGNNLEGGHFFVIIHSHFLKTQDRFHLRKE